MPLLQENYANEGEEVIEELKDVIGKIGRCRH
jgi:hypothetical protein